MAALCFTIEALDALFVNNIRDWWADFKLKRCISNIKRSFLGSPIWSKKGLFGSGCFLIGAALFLFQTSLMVFYGVYIWWHLMTIPTVGFVFAGSGLMILSEVYEDRGYISGFDVGQYYDDEEQIDKDKEKSNE